MNTGFFHNQTSTEQEYKEWFSHNLIQENRYKMRTLAGYVEDVWKPVEPLTITAGVRYDHWKNYDNMFSNYTDSRPGDRTDNSWSPKIGLRYNFANALSLWANYGTGFNRFQNHSKYPWITKVVSSEPGAFTSCSLTPYMVRSITREERSPLTMVPCSIIFFTLISGLKGRNPFS